ncbi:MAG: thioredoxin family protein [Runella sp.]
MKNSLILIFAVILTVGLVAFHNPSPPKEEAKIQWVSLQEAYKLNQKQPRKVFVDMYTDWCGWCKVMDKNTFKNEEVISLANKKFYAVKYNPEKDADVLFGNVSFRGMMNGKVTGYPTTVLLDEKMNLIQPIAGYLEPRVFHQILAYFGDNHYQKEPFEQFKTQTYPTKYTAKAQ